MSAVQVEAPREMWTIIEKMKKRQMESTQDDSPDSAKRTKVSNLRFDLKAVVVHAHQTPNSERFTVIVCEEQDSIEESPRMNAHFDEELRKIYVRPDKEETYTEDIDLGSVIEVSRYHGGKENEKKYSEYAFGDSIVLKRVSMSRVGDVVYKNVHWVEHAKESYEFTIPKSMTWSPNNTDSYYYVFSDFDFEENPTSKELLVARNNKIYAKLLIKEADQMGHRTWQGFLWQEQLHKFGIYNPETLENCWEELFEELNVRVMVSIDKEEKLSIRDIIFEKKSGKYTTSLYEALQDSSFEKVAVDDFSEGKEYESCWSVGHPLNTLPNSKVINLSEWTGNINEDLPSSIECVCKVGGCWFALLSF
jgi:hypothetical protein